MTTINNDTASTNHQEIFDTSCKKLGERLNSVENALLCYAAYVAYNTMHPETMQGKGNSSDRDASIPAFRNAAAEKSGVAVSTIDALLQVGRAMGPLPEEVKDALKSSHLGSWTTGLRKLATSKFDKTRASIITKFAEAEKVDAEEALKSLKETLGIKEKSQGDDTVQVAAKVAPTKQAEKSTGKPNESSQQPAANDSFDMQVGPFHVRIMVKAEEKEQVEALLKWASDNAPAGLLPQSSEVPGQAA
jgi:hypothetical protein